MEFSRFSLNITEAKTKLNFHLYRVIFSVRYVCLVVFLASNNIVFQDSKIFGIMLLKERLTIDKISLELRILNVKNLFIECSEVFITHLISIQLQVVTEKDLNLFGTNIGTTILDLSQVSISVFRFTGKHMPLKSQHLWYLGVFFLLTIGVLLSLPLPRMVACLFWQLFSLESSILNHTVLIEP